MLSIRRALLEPTQSPMSQRSLTLRIFVAIILAASGAHGRGSYVVGPNVQVSLSQPTLQHFETQIGADPQQAGHLIAGAYVVNSDRTIDNVFYVSFDHGRTWTHTLTVREAVDPSCAIGINGTAFVASIHDVTGPDGKSDSFLVVHRSTDGGRTWQESSIGIETRSIDRTYVTFDDSRGPLRGRVYVHGSLTQRREASGKPLPSAFALYSSTDGGRFDHAITRESTGFRTPWFFPANGVVSDDGTFLALVVELDKSKRNMFLGQSDAKSAPHEADGRLVILRSRDGGQTVEPTSIADVYYDSRVPQLSMSSLAIDRSTGPFRQRMYAVWPDARAAERTQIFLSYSSNGGKTWSAPRVVSDDEGALKPGDRPNNFMPMVAVNRKGVVGISWYDRRDNPDNLGYWPRFCASLDGGRTWLPSTRVSTSANLVTDDKETRFNSGDTAGLPADADGVFHPLWIDNRTGIHQMWTTTVAVRGAVRPRLQKSAN
jgi:hypothetical protein